MTKASVLDRVASDLTGGRTHPAIQRLSSLVASFPTDLELRERLAAVHRRIGNPVQAGRWGYLSEQADPAETTAFERAYHSAALRLRALGWPQPPVPAATAYARRRLRDLSRLARRAPVPRLGRLPRLPRLPRRVVAATVGGAVVIALVVLGAETVIAWILR